MSISRRSSDIIDSLSVLRTEFEKYRSIISKAHKQVGTAYTSLSELEGVRIQTLIKKLDAIEQLKDADFSTDKSLQGAQS
jgi:DNA recombination protein RmuC